MGAAWYDAFTVFGYGVNVNGTFEAILEMLKPLEMEEPFDIHNIQLMIHSRMEGMDDNEREYMEEEYGKVVIGFVPSNNMIENCSLAEKLDVFIEKCEHILGSQITFSAPQFYSGIV